MNKKVIILIIFAVYLLTIAVITAVVIAGKKEFKPLISAAKQIKIDEISSRDLKKETGSPAASMESPAAAAEEKEFEPPIEGQLLY